MALVQEIVYQSLMSEMEPGHTLMTRAPQSPEEKAHNIFGNKEDTCGMLQHPDAVPLLF